MVEVSLGNLKSLLIFFLPMLLPKAISYYRSVRSSAKTSTVQPLDAGVTRSLLLLAFLAAVYIVKSLPAFAPENIFALTASRLQISVDVLFTRLLAHRPLGLRAADDDLRSRIASLDARLLYFQYGHDTLTNCVWCSAEEPNTYFYYALPALLAPHLANMAVLMLVTSGVFTGREGRPWRGTAIISAIIVAAIDVYLVHSYPAGRNALATRVEAIDPFFWRLRTYRCLALALLDTGIGALLWLSASHRAFALPPRTAERLESSIRMVELTRARLNALGILRNTLSRDEELRERARAYWVHEGRYMRELMEEREVVDEVRHALEDRIDLAVIQRDAEAYAANIMNALPEESGLRKEAG